jgi:hypothetical protein
LPTQPLQDYRSQTAITATVSGFGATSASNSNLAKDLMVLAGLRIYDKCPAIYYTGIRK